MLHYLRTHGIHTTQQHGFLSGKSTETPDDWTLAVRDKRSVNAVNIDYAQAFDRICHEELLAKLGAYGIAGNLRKWIEVLSRSRTQQTKVGCSLSEKIKLTSGVVQGSVLGPLLFLWFINYVADVLSSERCVCKPYADDLKLYTTFCVDEDRTIFAK
jgi:ribonuclease P/MRP protein subunit RPP40